jgi:hypothetical protein
MQKEKAERAEEEHDPRLEQGQNDDGFLAGLGGTCQMELVLEMGQVRHTFVRPRNFSSSGPPHAVQNKPNSRRR